MMKWWGWGDKNISFPMADKPDLWPWVRTMLGIEKETLTPPVSREQLKFTPPKVDGGFLAALGKHLQPSQISSDEEERLLHSYGKSYPDLFNVRKGVVKQAPDLVLFPENHSDVEAIVKLCHEHNVCIVPFGGGTNIVGGVNPMDPDRRTVITVSLRRMNRLLALDPLSNTATIQAGAIGPKLEADLTAQGFSLGHFPDSFEYSTLGGWLATRSAGMQSDAYGKIEDMCVSIRVVTPAGTIVTRPVPASSAGPDLNRMLCGSEGTLGIITEATMRVHRVPTVKDYRGYLFKNFEDAVDAIRECIDQDLPPSMIRLQDSGETQLAFHMKKKPSGLKGLVQKGVKSYLAATGYTAPCILVIGFEGEPVQTNLARKVSLAILKKYAAFPLGASVGKSWSKDKFNIPYLRDYVMDRECMADVSETSATWSNVLPLYRNTIAALKERFKTDQGQGYVGCHISHTYKTGACLYFTYASKNAKGKELEQYYSYKNLVTDTFMESGGTLSHHHAIGIEHLPWMMEEVSPTGVTALQALKAALDPKGIMNPGKLIPSAKTKALAAQEKVGPRSLRPQQPSA